MQYTSFGEKNYAGGLKHRKLRPKTVEQQDNPHNSEICIVRIFQKYQSKCLKLKPGSSLYFTPKTKVSSDEEVWYTKTSVGKNTLRKIVQDMCRFAGIEGYKASHSLRATTCTIGLEKGVLEKLIMERTRHCTVKSLHTYQRVSDVQKEIVSDVLQGSASDFLGALVESEEPPTKRISECGAKENTAQFNFSNCSSKIIAAFSHLTSNILCHTFWSCFSWGSRWSHASHTMISTIPH